MEGKKSINKRTRRRKRIRKINPIILLIFFIIIIYITPKFISTAKYVYNVIYEHYLASKDFYFNSDKLNLNHTEYKITNNWSGAETYIVTTTTTDSVPTETTVTTTNTDNSSDTSTDDSESTAAKVTTAVTSATAVTTSGSDNTNNQITEFIDSVLTGDSFPAHAVRMTMFSSILIAISTFLFKRDNNEEEDKNEE